MAMVPLTLGHAHEYFQTLRKPAKLDWIAACAENAVARKRFKRAVHDVPCKDKEEEMLDGHPDIKAAGRFGFGQRPLQRAGHVSG